KTISSSPPSENRWRCSTPASRRNIRFAGPGARPRGSSSWPAGSAARPGGELASGAAVQSLVQYIAQTAGCFNSADVDKENEFLLHLETGMQRAHEKITDRKSTRLNSSH